MKRSKRILTIFVAIATVATLTVGLTASAAGIGSIIIHPPANNNLTLKDQTFDVYKVFDVVVKKDPGNDRSKDKYAYTLVGQFQDFEDDNKASFLGDNTLLEFISDPLTTDYMLIELANMLKLYVEGPPVIGPDKSGTLVAGETTITIEGLDPGYYLVLGWGTNEDNSGDVKPVHILVTVTEIIENPVDVYLKADAPKIDKDVWNHHDDAWKKWNDVSIGDIVDFRLKSAVPEMPGYNVANGGYKFVVHDLMSPGLTFDPGSVRITVGGQLQTLGVDYKFANPMTHTGASGCTFEIEFTPTIFVTYDWGAEIIILYSAELNANAVVGGLGNPNDVKLEYSNNPYSTGDGEWETDETEWKRVKVYTGQFSFVKVDEDGEELQNAQFKLLTVSGDETSAIWFKIVNGEYWVRSKEEEDNPVAGAVYTNILIGGTVVIKGLGASFTVYDNQGEFDAKAADEYGDYGLKEVKAPEGFYLLDDELYIRLLINCVYAGELDDTFYANWGLATGTPNASDPIIIDWKIRPDGFDIPNSAGSKLPGTGGIGRMIFFVTGIALMSLAVVGLVVTSARRKRKVVIE